MNTKTCASDRIRIIAGILCGALVVGGTICGAGAATEAKLNLRKVPPFEKVMTTLPFDVSLVVGKDQSVSVTGDAKVIPLIKSEVRDGTLELSVPGVHSFTHGEKANIVVTAPHVVSVNLAGSGNVNAAGVRATTFGAELSGSGSMNLNGGADEVNVVLSGSGNVDCKNLKAARLTVQSTGSGNIEAYATDSLAAKASGSGNIQVLGSPKSVQKSNTGSGTITY